MAKSAKKASKPKLSIFDEIVEALSEAGTAFKPKKNEDAQAQVRRLCETANDMPEDSWEALSEGAQAYLNTTLDMINNKKNKKPLPVPPGMDGADEDDDADEAPPAKSKGKAKAAEPEEEDDEDDDADEEDDEEEDDEEEEPAPKAKGKAKAAPAPAPAKSKGKAKAAEPEDDDEDDDADEDEKPAKKSGKGSFGGNKAAPFAPKPDGVTHKIRLVIAKHKKFMDITPDQIREGLAKMGIADAKSSSINTILGDMKSTVKALVAAGRIKE